MNKLHSELKIDLINALKTLDGAIEILAQAVMKDADLPCWIYQQPEGSNTQSLRLSLCRLLRVDEYEDGEDPKSCLFAPAFIGASDKTLGVIAKVNFAKDSVAAAFRALDKIKVLVKDPDTGLMIKEKLSTVTLRKLGRARYHRKISSRHFGVLDTPFDYASYAWGNKNKISRISINDAKNKLARFYKKNDDQFIEQMQKLDNLDEYEMLAHVGIPHLAPTINITLANGQKPKQRYGSNAFFFLSKAGEHLNTSRFSPLGPRPEHKERKERNDRRTEHEPYLAEIRVYRYLPPYRFDEK